jgi:hypothetical protein
MLLVAFGVSQMIGCKSPEQDAWQEGYGRSFKTAYRKGWQDGAAKGRVEGQEEGRITGERAAETGTGFALYSTLAFWACAFGVLIGLAIQYTVLVCCRLSERFPEILAMAFVPAVRRSICYSMLEKKRILMLWWDEEKGKVLANQKLKMAQMRAVQEVMVERLRAIATLQELSQARLVELAKKELDRIASAAEAAVSLSQAGDTGNPVSQMLTRCPHCGGKVSFPPKKQGRIVKCPHKACGNKIVLSSEPR